MLGFEIIVAWPDSVCRKLDHCTEDRSEHFVAGSDAPEMLKPVEASFDPIS